MTQDTPKKGKRWSGPIMIAAGALVLAMGGLALWFSSQLEAVQERLSAAKEQYEGMKTLKPELTRLIRQAPQGKAQDVDVAEIPRFLDSVRAKHNLPQPTISSNTPQTVGKWKEYATTLTFERSGPKEGGTNRAALVDFLAAVEKERPYLKSKNVTVTYGDGGVSSASVTFSYFKRE